MKIMCGWTLATASVVLSLVLACDPQTGPTTHAVASAATPATVQIAYPAYTRQNATLSLGTTGTLRVVGSDGSDDHPITTPTPVAGEVRWNPAGTQIAYVAALSDGKDQVWVINADGTGAHAVTPEGYQEPTWSPDGTRLAVVNVGTSDHNIAIADLATGTTHAITTNSFQAGGATFGSPVWAPDGSRLAFVTAVFDEGSGGAATVNVVNADGTGRIELPEPMDGALQDAREIAWSPDGTWLAFDGYIAAGSSSHGALQIVHPDGTGLRTINAGSSAVYGDGDIAGFSPDGSRVLVTLEESPPSRVVAVSLNGALTTFHVSSPDAPVAGNPYGDTSTSWLPSGTQIVFCVQTFTSSNVYVSNLFAAGANDSGLRQLTSSGQACDGSVASGSPRYAGADRVAAAIPASRATFTHATGQPPQLISRGGFPSAGVRPR